MTSNGAWFFMVETGLTYQIASFIHSVRIEDMSEEILQIARNSILDCIGVTLAGYGEAGPMLVREQTLELGGKGNASIFGSAHRTDPLRAALCNGTAAHVLDFDDIHGRPLFGHPSVCLVPAILALAEEAELSGAQVLEAYVTGFEVGVFLGYVLGDVHYQTGWHSTSNLGVMRVAAACSKLLNLEPVQTRQALGLAASLAGGLRANFGTMTKSLHAGYAAHNGILAVLLARKGFTANPEIVEADSGFAKVFSGKICSAPFQLGEKWFILSPGITLKKYPSCAGTHRGLDALLELVAQNRLGTEDIAAVRCGLPLYTTSILTYHKPETGLEGKFSMEYCLAAAIVDKKVSLDSFRDEKVKRPEIEQVLPLIETYALEDSTPENPYARVEVFLKDGRVLTKVVQHPKGEPANPFGWEEISIKFMQNTEQIIGNEKAVKVLGLLEHLDKVSNVNSLTRLLSAVE